MTARARHRSWLSWTVEGMCCLHTQACSLTSIMSRRLEPVHSASLLCLMMLPCSNLLASQDSHLIQDT